MKKDLKILFLDFKSHVFIYILPIFIIYCVFIPYTLSQLHYISSPYEREMTYFGMSQKYLTIFIIYYLWLLIKNSIDGPMTEVLASMDYKYHVRYVIYSILLYIIILIPYFIITYQTLGNVVQSVLGLIFQLIILSCAFYGMVMMFGNSLMILSFIIIFIILFTQFFLMQDYYLLFHVSALASELPSSYWTFHSLVGLIMIVIGVFFEIKKIYMK